MYVWYFSHTDKDRDKDTDTDIDADTYARIYIHFSLGNYLKRCLFSFPGDLLGVK